jgi:hypothetical protein
VLYAGCPLGFYVPDWRDLHDGARPDPDVLFGTTAILGVAKIGAAWFGAGRLPAISAP